MGKLYEQLIVRRLSDEIELRGGLSSHQFGFRKGRSTVHAIAELLRISREAHYASPREWCAASLVDVRNAFNSARWDKIIAALESM